MISSRTQWGLLFAAVLHGTGAMWLILALGIHFLVAKCLARWSPRGASAWAWSFSLALLFVSRIWGNKYWEEVMSMSRMALLALLIDGSNKIPTHKTLFSSHSG